MGLVDGGYIYSIVKWVHHCFGDELATSKRERNQRFLEEALELVQACECTASEAHQLVDYVFNRPVGEKGQEVAGTFVSLLTLCAVHGIDISAEAEKEGERIWYLSDKIREKQKTKPKIVPIPFDHNYGVDINQ